MRKKKNTTATGSQDSLSNIHSEIEQLKVFILTMERQKNELFTQLMEARKNSLLDHEEQARGLMRKCYAMQEQAQAMLMTLELAVRSRDIALLQGEFLERMDSIADKIGTVTVSKTKIKKTKDKYMHALGKSSKQADRLDELIESCSVVTETVVDSDKFVEYDQEIEERIKEERTKDNNTGHATV